MPDLDQRLTQDATRWKHLRWLLAQFKRHGWPSGSEVYSLACQAEREFEGLALEAERRREAAREASIKGTMCCALCLNEAMVGEQLCARCSLDYAARMRPARLSWRRWFANLWSLQGRKENLLDRWRALSRK